MKSTTCLVLMLVAIISISANAAPTITTQKIDSLVRAIENHNAYKADKIPVNAEIIVPWLNGNGDTVIIAKPYPAPDCYWRIAKKLLLATPMNSTTNKDNKEKPVLQVRHYKDEDTLVAIAHYNQSSSCANGCSDPTKESAELMPLPDNVDTINVNMNMGGGFGGWSGGSFFTKRPIKWLMWKNNQLVSLFANPVKTITEQSEKASTLTTLDHKAKPTKSKSNPWKIAVAVSFHSLPKGGGFPTDKYQSHKEVKSAAPIYQVIFTNDWATFEPSTGLLGRLSFTPFMGVGFNQGVYNFTDDPSGIVHATWKPKNFLRASGGLAAKLSITNHLSVHFPLCEIGVIFSKHSDLIMNVVTPCYGGGGDWPKLVYTF